MDASCVRKWGARAILAAAAVILVSLSACAERESGDAATSDTTNVDTTMTADANRPSIFAALQEESRFSRFAAAVDSAGLRPTLSGPGPFTVFAPTNEAFESMGNGGFDEMLSAESPDRLREVLLHHITNGERSSDDLQAGATLRTLEGSDLSVSGAGDSLEVGGAVVTEPDIRASNGIIHAIDQVLTPSESASV